MNHQDIFLQTRDEQGAIAAALLALQYADGCSSRNRCWSWAQQAIELVPTLAKHTGALSWPNTAAMREHLDTLQANEMTALVEDEATPSIPQPPTLLDQAKTLAARAQISLDAGNLERSQTCATLAQALAAIQQAETLQTIARRL